MGYCNRVAAWQKEFSPKPLGFSSFWWFYLKPESGSAMNSTAKILVKFASRGRPSRFFDGMENIFKMCARPDFIRVLVTIDSDDETMFNERALARFSEYGNAHMVVGSSKNKIDATNRDFEDMPEDWKDWDIIANYSDDQRFTAYGWDEMIRADFAQHSPDFSHFMAYLDPDTHGALSTLYIAGRKFYDKFGFIYDPQFVSLFCDNLVEDCAKRMGKFHYTGYSIYRHFNPSYNYADFPPDEMYKQQQSIGWDIDQKTYYRITQEVGIEKYLQNFGIVV